MPYSARARKRINRSVKLTEQIFKGERLQRRVWPQAATTTTTSGIIWHTRDLTQFQIWNLDPVQLDFIPYEGSHAIGTVGFSYVGFPTYEYTVTKRGTYRFTLTAWTENVESAALVDYIMGIYVNGFQETSTQLRDSSDNNSGNGSVHNYSKIWQRVRTCEVGEEIRPMLAYGVTAPITSVVQRGQFTIEVMTWLP